MRIFMNLPLMVVTCLVLASCSNNPNITNDEKIVTKRERLYEHMDKLLGEDTLLFSSNPKNKKSQNTVGIGINTFLWRASLDIVSFMSLRSVDPFGGVIITEWFTSQENPHERFKIDILITSRTLRADGIRVIVAKQFFKNGQWINGILDNEIAQTFEDAILTRARQIYNNDPAVK